MHISRNLKILLLFAVFVCGFFAINNYVASTNKVSALGPGVTRCPGEPGNCNHPPVPGQDWKFCGGSSCITDSLPTGYNGFKLGCEGPQADCRGADVRLGDGVLANEPCGWTNMYEVKGPNGFIDYISWYGGDCATPPVNPNHLCSADFRVRFNIKLKNNAGQSGWVSPGNLSTNWLSQYTLDEIENIKHAVFIGDVSNNVRFYGRVRLETPALDSSGRTERINYYDANAGKTHTIPAEWFKAGQYNLRVISQHPNQNPKLCDEKSFTVRPTPLACGVSGCSTNSDCATGNSCVSGQCRLTQCVNSPTSCNNICSPKTNSACGQGCYNNGVPNSQGTCASGNLCVQNANGTYSCKRTQCVSAPETCNTTGCSIYTQCNQTCNPGIPGGGIGEPEPPVNPNPGPDPGGGGAVMGVTTDAIQSTCAPGYLCNPNTSRCVLAECLDGSASCDSTMCIAQCTPTVPDAATLITPKNDNRVPLGSNNSVNFSFLLGDYGDACPTNNNTYSLQLNQVEIGQPCGATFVSYGQVSTAQNLLPNKRYCWRIVKNNGSRTSISEVASFITYLDTAAIAQDNSVKADVCGGGFSGKLGNTNVSNPIVFDISATKSNSTSVFRELWFAMITSQGSNQNIMSLDSIRTRVNTDRTMGFRYVIPASGSPTVYTMTSSGGGWSSAGLSANGTSITNGFGTSNVIEIGTNTTVTVSSNNLTGKVKVQFNDSHSSNQYHVYAAVIYSGGDGNLYSSGSTVANQFNFTRIPTKNGALNWGVDLISPAATVTTPVYNADGTFSVNWSSTDNLSGVKNNIYSYITATEPDSLINEVGFGDITPIIGTTPAPPTVSNGRITTPNLTTKTYRDVRPELGSQFNFIMHVEDNACNKTSTNSESVGTQPWLLSYKGSTSSNSGIVGVVPNQTNFTIPGTSDSSSNFVSTYNLISGNALLPNRKLSKYEQYTRNYFNAGALPPSDSGFTSWYDYTLAMIQRNVPQTNNRGTLNGQTTFNSGNISQTNVTVNGSGISLTFPGQQKGNNYLIVNGNATFNQGFVCDRNIVIFVTGTVTINPDFNVNGTNCVVISRENITIQNGSNKTGNVSLSSSTLASYDIVNGFLVTDGNVITQTDNGNGNTRKWDGLQITGGLVAKDFVLQRSINLSANALQPATIVIHDPRYREIFGVDFSFNRYSIREEGI